VTTDMAPSRWYYDYPTYHEIVLRGNLLPIGYEITIKGRTPFLIKGVRPIYQ